MRIHFLRSGGMLPSAMRRSVVIDSAQLPADEAQELENLVASAGLRAGPAASPPEARPDRFVYQITVEESGQQHQLQFADPIPSEALQRLVAWLLKRA